MPAGTLSLASAQVSAFLHRFVYAFPSPSNSRTRHDASFGVDLPDDAPGDVKAIAAGVGPLTFAGSTYGIILVLMVGTRASPSLTTGNLAQSHHPHRPCTARASSAIATSPGHFDVPPHTTQR